MISMTVLKRSALIGMCVLLGGCGLSAMPPVTVTIKPATEGAAVATTGTTGTTATEGAPVAAAGGTGDLTGVVLFDGTPPTLPNVLVDKDVNVCGAMPIPDESLVVDSATKGIKDVFIFFDKAPTGAAPIPPPDKQIFDQRGCKFIPHALICRIKVPVLVMSDDAVGHNTHTYPGRNNPFNQGIKPKETTGIPINYDKSEREPFRVVCDIHPWMKAYHLPLDHGYAALTNEKGEFTIKGLPAGSHKVKVWHEGKMLERELKIDIPLKKPVELKYAAAKFGK